MSIIKRRLTPDEAKVLVMALRDTPNITGYTEQEWLHFPDVWVAEQDGRMAGVGINEDMGAKWTYITALFVLESYRGRGLGKVLFATLLQDIADRKRSAFTVSRNPQVIAWMKESGMSLTTNMWKSPVPILFDYIFLYIRPYRIQEFLRKSSVYKKQPEWVYGRLEAKPTSI